jgi:hypothetical protein
MDSDAVNRAYNMQGAIGFVIAFLWANRRVAASVLG